MATKPANRTADLAAIHIAQKALGIDKDAAAELKMSVIGKASSADMTPAERRKYLAHLSVLQGQAKPRAARAEVQRSTDDAGDERWHKARMLWTLLARAGAVRIDTDQALLAYVQRQTKADAWRFLNGYQINTVIESLKRWCVRAEVKFDHG